MNKTSFDDVAAALAAGVPRRHVVLGLGGVLAGGVASLVGLAGGRRSRPAAGLSAQPEPTPTPDPITRPAFDPIFPTLDPIPIGDDLYQLDNQTFYLDPAVAEILVDEPIVPITVGDNTLFIDSTVAVPTEATPGAELATPTGSFPESVCGADDSWDVEPYPGTLGVSQEFVGAHQRPVGNLRWNNNLIELYQNPGTVNARRWCSGTLITDNLLLTAGHCFEQRPPGNGVPRIDGTENPIPRSEIATNMHVDFRYQLDPHFNEQPWFSFPVIELVEDRLGDLDYAIVRLEGTPGLTHGVARIAAADPAQGEMICIIGHPNGWPKRIEAGPASQFENHLVFYNDIDTAPVSSGSGILFSPEGLIVGVHTNGGCREDQSGNNHGVRISSLLQVSPILQQLSGGKLESA